jgi:hypothetical protein
VNQPFITSCKRWKKHTINFVYCVVVIRRGRRGTLVPLNVEKVKIFVVKIKKIEKTLKYV